MTDRSTTCCIAGGGPAGMMLGFLLARAGVDVLVLDRAKFPRDKVCAEYLSPQASRVLHDMGVLDRVEASGPAHLRGMRVRAPNGAVADGEFASSHGFRGFRDKGLAIRRIILDEIVLRGAQDAAGDLAAVGDEERLEPARLHRRNTP